MAIDETFDRGNTESKSARGEGHPDASEERLQQYRGIIEQLQEQGDADRALIANLNTALVTSRRIGAAVGVLTTTRQLSYDQAFQLLADASQYLNCKLRDLAEHVLLTGALPDKSQAAALRSTPRND